MWLKFISCILIFKHAEKNELLGWLQQQLICTFLGIMNYFELYFILRLMLLMVECWNNVLKWYQCWKKIQVTLYCYISDLNIRNEGILLFKCINFG